MNLKFTRLYVICYHSILFWGRSELWPFNQRWSFFFLGGCMLEHLSFKGYSSAMPKRKVSKQALVFL